MLSDPILGDLHRQRRRNAADKLSKSVLSSHGGSSTGQNSDKKHSRRNGATLGHSAAQRHVQSSIGFQYRSLQVNRKNSTPFDTNSSGGRRTVAGREDGSLGRTTHPSPVSRIRQPTFSSSQKKRMPAMNRSLIITPHETSMQLQPETTKNSGGNVMGGATGKPTRGGKKVKKVVKRVVRKIAVTNALQNQAALLAPQGQLTSLQSTPDASNYRLKMSQTTSNLKVSNQGSYETKTPKLRKNYSSHLQVSKLNRNLTNSSMSSLNAGMISGEVASSSLLNRSMQPTRSMPSLMSGKAGAVAKQKRFGTPIKTRGRAQQPTSKIFDDEEEDDELIQNLQKEIEELRAKRLNHDFFKKNTIDDDDEDNFETAFFAETLLGELGSSSCSQSKKQGDGDDEADAADDDNDVLEGDSGASDQGMSARQHQIQPKIEQSPTAVSLDQQNATEETKTASPQLASLEETKVEHSSVQLEEQKQQLPIVDIPADTKNSSDSKQSESPAVSKRSQLEMNLISQLESEISGLLGSIKVQASSIKETLKKQKSILTEGGEAGTDETEAAPIKLDQISIEVADNDGTESRNESELDQSMNSVVRQSGTNDNDDAVSLNESICSVVRVATTPEKDEKTGADAEASEKGDDEKMNLTKAQFEVLISDLKTKQLAEKRMLQCDLSLCKKVVKQMINCMRAQAKERQRNEIRFLQIKKLQEANKFFKTENQELTMVNKVLTDQCSNLKVLMMEYERESLYQRLESDYVYEQLAKENDALKRLLLINHDFTSSIEDRMREIEQQEQEKQLEKFRELQEKARQNLEAGLALAKQIESQKSEDSEAALDDDLDSRDDLDGDDNEKTATDSSKMPKEVMQLVQKRMEETQKDKKPGDFNSSDMYLEDFKRNFGQAESRNAASRSNRKIQQIKVSNDAEDDDEVENNSLRQSFGKRSSGGGSLAQLKSKLTLQQELGALRSELGKFETDQSQNEAVKSSWIKDMDSVDQRDDADDLDDEDSEEDAGSLGAPVQSRTSSTLPKDDAPKPAQTTEKSNTEDQPAKEESKAEELKATDQKQQDSSDRKQSDSTEPFGDSSDSSQETLTRSDSAGSGEKSTTSDEESKAKSD